MHYSNLLKIIKILASLAVAAGTTGCAAAPDVRSQENIAVSVHGHSDFDLDIVNVAEPQARPGRLAGDMAKQGLSDCSDANYPIASILMAPLCAGVGAASGALLGAAVTQSTTIPDEDARSLNIASLNAVIGINWTALLEGELRKEALEYGKQTVPAGHGVPVSVQIVDLQWNTSVGDRLAIHAVIEVSMWGSDGQRLTDSIKLRGKRMHVAKWTTDDGAPIRAAMQELISDASEAVWQSIAG